MNKHIKRTLLIFSFLCLTQVHVQAATPTPLNFDFESENNFFGDYENNFFPDYELLRPRGANYTGIYDPYRGMGAGSGMGMEVVIHIPNDPMYSSKGNVYSGFENLQDQWALHLLNMSEAWQYSKGSGVVVAVVDTGVMTKKVGFYGPVTTHGDLEGQLTNQDDWFDIVDGGLPDDKQGHGTHIAGIIAAKGDNGKGMIGIAPESKIMPVRVTKTGASTPENNWTASVWSQVAEGIIWAAQHGSRVINVSLSSSTDEYDESIRDLMYDAIAAARAAGAIVVVSAGNDNSEMRNYFPSGFDNVITVGALSHQYDSTYSTIFGQVSRANFSNYGMDLDFMAPGVDILSTSINGSYGNEPLVDQYGDYYTGKNGTSFSAPMVSGLIALLLAQNPLQTFADIYRRLEFSSIDMGAAGFDEYYGHGRIDALAALSHDYYNDGRVRKFFDIDNTWTEYVYWGTSPTNVTPRVTTKYDANNREIEKKSFREDGSLFYTLNTTYALNGALFTKTAVMTINPSLSFDIIYGVTNGVITSTKVYQRGAGQGAGAQGTGPLVFTIPTLAPPEEVFRRYAASALPTDGNKDGVVNDADQAVWRANFGNTQTNPAIPLEGDYNGDGVVDAADWVLWRKQKGNSIPPQPTPLSPADGNKDGVVDNTDNEIWRGNFGDTAPVNTPLEGDYNGNGAVDAADYVLWRKNAQPAPAAATAAATSASLETQAFGGAAYFEMQENLAAQRSGDYSRDGLADEPKSLDAKTAV